MDSGLWIIAPFLAGLFGSVHCVAMCGGIAGALGYSAAESGACSRLNVSALLSGGRIVSYALLGALAGGIGTAITLWLEPTVAGYILRIAAGVMLVSLGLSIAANLHAFPWVQRAGNRLWLHVRPATRHLLPVRHPAQVVALGALWGMLPCGLLYTMLLAAAASGSVTTGAVAMLSFGAGTLPSMVATGWTATWLARVRTQRFARYTAGLLLTLTGAWSIVSSGGHLLMDPSANDHATHHHSVQRLQP